MITRPLVVKKEGENPWITFQKRDVLRKNLCVNGIITGDPGKGKSWAMISMACALDPDFKLEGNLYFKAGDMMRDIQKYYSQEHPKKGKMWLFDEAGIDANNMNFRDQINRGLNAFFQTARHRNYIFWMTVPQFNFVSKGVRTMMTAHLKADGWIAETKQTRIIPRILQYNGEIDKMYRKRLLVRNNDSGGLGMCSKILLPAPPKHIIDEYEKMKKEFTGDLFGDIASKISREEEKKKAKVFGKELTAKQERTVSLLKLGKNVEEISKITGRNTRCIYTEMANLKKKGIKIISERGPDRRVNHKVIDMREG